MPRSPETSPITPGESKDQEQDQETKQEIGEKFIKGLAHLDFMATVIDRKCLVNFAQALEKGDLKEAEELAAKKELALGNDIEELRLEYIFGHAKDAKTKKWKEMLEQANHLHEVARMAVGAIKVKRQENVPVEKKDLEEVLNTSKELYDYLEQMIPKRIRKQHIERYLKEEEQWLTENPDSPKAAEVTRERNLLLSARERLGRESSRDNREAEKEVSSDEGE